MSVCDTTSPRTIFTLCDSGGLSRSDCGTQSRTRQTTSAPAATNRRTSQPPTKAGAAGDKRRAVAPEGGVERGVGVHFHTFHSALPLAHKLLSN